MEKLKTELKNEKKLILTQIKETPFQFATNGEINYLICGKVILETEKNEEEVKEWIKEKNWEQISLLIQGICNEMLNEKN